MVNSLARKIEPEEIQQKEFVDIPEDELRWSTVSLKEVIGRELRLEASVFDIEGKNAREVIKNCGCPLINICGENGIAIAYHRPRFKRIFVENSEYPIYQPSQINEIYPRPYLFISDKTDTDLDNLRVHKNQILLTCSGTIGNISLVSKTQDNKIFSHDLIRISVKNENETGYLYAILKSKIGNILINTNNYGAVIQHIEPEHLENILVPNPSDGLKKRIHQLIIASFELRDQSNEMIDEAEKLLIAELKLPPIEELKPEYFDRKTETRNYEVKLSELDERFDGSYHLPIVNCIINHINKYAQEVTTICDNNISQGIILPGRFKRIYVEEGQGTVFFGGKQIMELDPSSKKYLSINHKSRIDTELVLKENMVLITRSGTIGKVNIAPKHWENWVINEHVIRIIPESNAIAGFIYAWLSSEYGYELITRFTYGAVVDEIDDNHVAQIQIPLLKNKNIQNKINGLVLEANKKRYEAYVLEQKAMHILNDNVFNTQK
jgi:Type I restriction modification DNA specificity domain.